MSRIPTTVVQAMPLSVSLRPASPVFGGLITPPPPPVLAVGIGGGGAVVAVAAGPQFTVTSAEPVAPPEVAVIFAVPPVAGAVKIVRMPPPLVVAVPGLTLPLFVVTVTEVPSATFEPPVVLTTTVTKDEPLQLTVEGAAETVTDEAVPGVVVTVAVGVVEVAVTVGVAVATGQFVSTKVTV